MGNSVTNIVDDLRLLSQPVPLWWWFVAIAIVAVLYGVIAEVLKRKKRAVIVPHSTGAQIVEDALAELEKLRKTMSREESRIYATKASGIVRRYIERKFAIEAPCRSTEEFLAEARESKALSEKDRQLLGNFLNSCDFLKFACAYAEKDELEKLHNLAVEFVNRTSSLTPNIEVNISKNIGNYENLSSTKSANSAVSL